MRLRTASLIARIFFTVCGAALFITGIFAYSLGLDNDPGWGIGRALLAGAGLLCLLAAAGLQFHQWVWRVYKAVSARLDGMAADVVGSAVGRLTRRLGTARFIQRVRLVFKSQDGLFAVLGALMCVLIGLWFISAGRMTVWTPSTHYFDQLADGFLSGQLSLVEQPSAELLAMPNPYDWQARRDQGVSVVWDASLYYGKYYLYWGPAPALLAAGVKLALPGQVDDSALLFFFYCGIILFSALSLFHLRRRYFPRSAAWLLLPLILLAGLSAPMMWLVNRPSVYETAIAGGQFFLTLGLYSGLRALDSKNAAVRWLLAAGLAWGAAVGCRLTLAPAVGVFVLVLLICFLKTRSIGRFAVLAVCLGAPLLLWAAGLGWYNLARFGSLLETGHRYQLTGPALPANYADVSSIKYALPSLYSYLVRPPLISLDEFPFVWIPFIKESMWPFFIRLPEHYYYPEPVAGLLTIAPAIWLLGLPLLGWLRRLWLWLQEKPAPPYEGPRAAAYAWALLAGGSAALFLPLLIFISTSLRYLADVLPTAACLTALCLWWGLDFFASRPALRRALILVALILVLAGVFIGVFSGFTAGDVPFETRNPALFQYLQSLFR